MKITFRQTKKHSDNWFNSYFPLIKIAAHLSKLSQNNTFLLPHPVQLVTISQAK